MFSFSRCAVEGLINHVQIDFKHRGFTLHAAQRAFIVKVVQEPVLPFLTFRFVSERLAALVRRAVADRRRFVEAVGHARRRLRAARPTGRLCTRPSHQVLHPHHHLPRHRQNLILSNTGGKTRQLLTDGKVSAGSFNSDRD